MRCVRLLSGVLVVLSAAGQKAALTPASPVQMPAVADCNSPAHWRHGEIHVFNSAGAPMISSGVDQFHLGAADAIRVDSDAHFPMWIEATWLDPGGALYAWYHNEPAGLCSGALTVPRIGALASYDGGRTFQDLGIVLESGDPADCSSANGFFAGGHGDFSVIPDREGKYFYFLFGNYGGSAETQGVAIARMAIDDRQSPVGKVWKYFSGDWTEPGVKGRITPIFPAKVSWQRPETDSFWGPSIHWNTYLKSYVVLLNHSCCRPKWPQEGSYVSFNTDVSDPGGWSKPDRIMAKPPDYYPEALGLEPDGTDTLAGQTARFYIHGRSSWEIAFFWPAPEAAQPPASPTPAPSSSTSETPAWFAAAGPAASYPIATSILPPGAGSVTAVLSPVDGNSSGTSSVQLTARAEPGYRFVNWSGDVSGEANPNSAPVNAELRVTANFVPLPPALSVASTHSGDFRQGHEGAVYTVTVSNSAGAGPTAGAVTLSEALPSDLTLISLAGQGWDCSGTVCSRSDVLAGGASYPALTVTVRVAPNAASPLLNRVTVSGGGSAAAETSDATLIAPAQDKAVPVEAPVSPVR